MKFDNVAACRYWLDRLGRQEGITALLGQDLSPVLHMAGVYENGCGPLDFGAEIQLAGQTGIDLSVQYPLKDFAHSSPLQHPLISDAGNFLHAYTKQLAEKKIFRLISGTFAYLEADTSGDEVDSVAIFLNLSGEAARVLLPFILQEQGQEDRLSSVREVLRQVEGELSPWYFGFMNSRAELPLRLALYSRGGLPKLVSALQRLGIGTGEVVQQLTAINQLGLFTFMLDLDILADGTIGNTYGIELVPVANVPQRQKRMLKGKEYAAFLELLRGWGMADDRSRLLSGCFWECDYHDRNAGDYIMYSFLSHFKLRWQQGRSCPAKVYIQLRELVRQASINEFFKRIR